MCSPCVTCVKVVVKLRLVGIICQLFRKNRSWLWKFVAVTCILCLKRVNFTICILIYCAPSDAHMISLYSGNGKIFLYVRRSSYVECVNWYNAFLTCFDTVDLHWLPVKFRILFKISLLTLQNAFMKNSLFIFTPCLSHHSHPFHCDQTKELVCQSLGSRPTQMLEHFTLVPLLFGTTSLLSVGPFGHFGSYLQETSEDTSLWLGLSPIDTGTPDSSLMLRNCFIYFAVENRFVCGTTEPGLAGNIGGIEIWLIDWFNWAFSVFFCLLLHLSILLKEISHLCLCCCILLPIYLFICWVNFIGNLMGYPNAIYVNTVYVLLCSEGNWICFCDDCIPLLCLPIFYCTILPEWEQNSLEIGDPSSNFGQKIP